MCTSPNPNTPLCTLPSSYVAAITPYFFFFNYISESTDNNGAKFTGNHLRNCTLTTILESVPVKYRFDQVLGIRTIWTYL